MPFQFSNPSGQNIKSPIVICNFTHKGGVGKTTGTYNLAALLAKKCRVLVVDGDPQCNLSKSIIQAKVALSNSLLEKEEQHTLGRKVAKVILQAGEHKKLETPGYSLRIMFNKIYNNQDQLLKALSKDGIDSSQVFLYKQRPVGAVEDDSYSVPTFEDDYSWHILLRNAAGDIASSSFDEELEKVLTQDDIAKKKTSTVQKKKLLFLATMKLGLFEHNIESELAKLIPIKISFLDNLKSSDYNPDYDIGYVISKDGNRWGVFYAHPEKANLTEIKLEQVTGLQLLLESCNHLTPENLPDIVKDKTKSLIRRFCHYINFLDVFNSRFLDESSKAAIEERIRQLSLISLKYSDVSRGKPADDEGELLLLPGNYSLLLELGRKFSFGIQGLATQDVFSAFSKNIYAVNEFIRRLGELHNVDVVMIDLSPSADDFNSTMLMTSDYFLTTVNPEPYSDDAMASLVTIFSRWSKDFAPLYRRDSAHGNGFRLIQHPPKCIGYFFQKMQLEGHRLRSNADAMIAHDVKSIFDKEVLPILKENGMYPEFGIEGFDDDSLPISDKISQDIPVFTKEQKEAQYDGYPIVWQDKATFLSAFQRVMLKTIGRTLLNDNSTRPAIKEYLTHLQSTRIKAEVEFAKKCSDAYVQYCGDLELKSRVSHVKDDDFYRCDFIDMIFQTTIIRSKFNHDHDHDHDHGLHRDEERMHNPVLENKYGVLLLDPSFLEEKYKANGFSLVIQDAFSKIHSWKKLNYIIAPIFFDRHWLCLRVFVDDVNAAIQILIDDPCGGELQGLSNSMVKINEKRNIIPYKEFIKPVLSIISDALGEYYRCKFKHKRWQIKNISWLGKEMDQQGFLFNDVSSGMVVLSNISDYLKVNSVNHKLYPNRVYEQKAKEFVINKILHVHNIKRKDVKVIDPYPQESVSTSSLYTWPQFSGEEGKYFCSRKRQVKEWRHKKSSYYNKHHDLFEKLISDDNFKSANAEYLKIFGDYIQEEMNKIMVDQRGLVIQYIGNSFPPSLKPSQVVTLLQNRRFNPAYSQSRTKKVGDKSCHRKADVTSVMNFLLSGGISNASVRSASKSTISRDSSFGGGLPLPKGTGTSYVRPVNSRSSLFQTTFVSDVQTEEGLTFEHYTVAGDGNCAYTAFGVSRENAFDKLTESLTSGSQQQRLMICEILEPAIREATLQDDFLEHLLQTFTDKKLKKAITQYRKTQATESLYNEIKDDLRIARAYLEYDIQQRKFDAGYCHLAVLHALATVYDVNLKLWKKNETNHIVPHIVDSQHTGIANSHDLNPSGKEEAHMLFMPGAVHHYELLLLKTPADKNEELTTYTPIDSDTDDSSYNPDDENSKRQKEKQKEIPSKRKSTHSHVGREKSKAPSSQGKGAPPPTDLFAKKPSSRRLAFNEAHRQTGSGSHHP